MRAFRNAPTRTDQAQLTSVAGPGGTDTKCSHRRRSRFSCATGSPCPPARRVPQNGFIEIPLHSPTVLVHLAEVGLRGRVAPARPARRYHDTAARSSCSTPRPSKYLSPSSGLRGCISVVGSRTEPFEPGWHLPKAARCIENAREWCVISSGISVSSTRPAPGPIRPTADEG